ncbi:MAG: alcohol dehydrogenase [Chloroflexi bacterium]|nr:alcohol dehydrogenase [Chloroflexota bacterium]
MKTKAAILYQMELPAPYNTSRPLQIEDVQLDAPGTGEVLVEIAAAGLCHSDLSVIDGSRPRVMPMVMGHEAAGIVREVGPTVSEFRDGDHVVFSFVPSCGTCIYCATGRAALCENGARANVAGTLLSGARRFTNHHHQACHHHLGVSAFTQFTVVAQESLVKIDPVIPLDKAALFGCAVLTGVGAVVNTARVEPGSSVAVFGMGGVGLSTVMGAAAAGAYPIIAVDVIPDKLLSAQKIGASHIINAAVDNPVQAIREITKGGTVYSFECVGNERVLLQAYEATGRGGMTITMGLPHPSKQFSISAVSMVVEERTIKGSYMGSAVPRRDIPRFIQMYQAGHLPVEQLLTHTLSIDEINMGFDRLAKAEAVRQIITF